MLNNAYWALNQTSSLDLGDTRRTRRAAQLLRTMIRKPDAGLPRQTGSWGELKAAYRLLHHPAVTRKAVLKPHFQQTRDKATGRTTLFVQDTSELDFTLHNAATGFGPIGDHRGKGLLVHSLLALSPDGQVLGLAGQECWARSNSAPHKKTETRAQRCKRTGRESDVWSTILQQPGSVPSGSHWVSIGDRGSDCFGYWRTAVDAGWQCLSRVFTNRKTETDVLSLTRIRTRPACGVFQVEQRARPGKPACELNLSLAWEPVVLPPPQNEPRLRGKPPLPVTLLRCWDETHDVEWLLLATWPISRLEEARQAVAWYAMRWSIEEFHKALKTGCGIEKSQLKQASSVETLLGFSSLIAVRLLALARDARHTPQALARSVVEDDWLAVLCQHQCKNAETLTVSEFYREVAKLGGFLGRKHDGNPGWQTLWHGWQFLTVLVEGYCLAKKCG
jgi:hypothetical protein